MKSRRVKSKSIKKNYICNLILTSVNLIFPLITSPHLSTVLGAENIGKVNYATSIVNWFILFASFGIPRYGIREIARNRDSKKKLSMSFWNLILIQFILSSIAIVIYIIMILSINKFKSDLALYFITMLMILLSIFSIDWFYQGIEEYGYITIRNIIFKIISILLIFTMIKDKDNYYIYAGINVFGLSFNNILNYLHARKYVYKKMFEFRLIYYLKELRVYFFTTLIIALYTQLDSILIGYKSKTDLAYYVRSKTIAGIGMSITNSVVTVFIPRTAYLIEKDYHTYRRIIQKAINYIYILALPCIVGIYMLATEIIYLLGKSEFIPAVPSLKIISVLILINCVGGWQINQILIPHRLEKVAFRIQCIGALMSFSLNLFLINKFSYIGGAITWVITEITIAIMSAMLIRKKCSNIRINYLNQSFIKYMISSIIMSILIIIVKMITLNYNYRIILSITLGPIVYFGIVFLLKDQIAMDIKKSFLKMIKK